MLLAQGCCAMCRGVPDFRPHRDDYWISTTETQTRSSVPRLNVPILRRTVSKSQERRIESSPRMRFSPRELQFELEVQSTEQNMAMVSDTTLGEAEELIKSNMETASTEHQQELVNFTDNSPGEFLNTATAVDYTIGDESQSIDLEKFLIRPVKIFQTTWTEGASIARGTQIYPWHLYFNNAQIKKKLDNYFLLKCNLKLKLVINASPFYYGCGFMAYQPLYSFEENWDHATNPDYFTDSLISQKPIVYFYPQTNSGCEMSLPWCYHKEWVDATSAADLQGLGRLCISSFTDLKNANSVVGSNVQVTLYAWAEDVKIAGPTQKLAVQSREGKFKDEYDGVISKPASAIARFSGALSGVPVIGEFATATGAIAGAIGGIASIFGFSRVPSNDKTQPYRSKTNPNFANTDIPEVIDKLTFDSKNELSVDPKICGVPLSDEMDITSFVKRESLFTSFTWTSAAVTGDWLQVFRVSPSMRNITSRTNEYLMEFTPMSYVSQLFQYWRGDIIIKLKIICSQYHKGRLEVTWDPVSPLNSIADSSMINYTHILDISEQTEIEFRVPYTQPTAYSETRRAKTSTFRNSTPFSPTISMDNGTLGIRVLNPQTSPVASADITILAYVRGDDNLEFAGPVPIDQALSPYVVQSKETNFSDKQVGCELIDIGIKASSAPKEINLIYHGETVTSFRVLMQRMNRYFSNCDDGTGTVSSRIVTYAQIPRMLMYPGFDPNGLHTANDIKGVSTSPANLVGWHYANWLALAFVANRGSIIYTANGFSPSNNNVCTYIQRAPTETSRIISNTATNTTNSSVTSSSFLYLNDSGLSGLTLTSSKTQSAITAGVPMYSQFKMLSNNPSIRTLGSTIDGSNNDTMYIAAEDMYRQGTTTSQPLLDVYAGVGVDFSLVFFTGLQPLYWYDSAPTGA